MTKADLNILPMAIQVVSFQTGGTKLERFLPKNQHTQRKPLFLENTGRTTTELTLGSIFKSAFVMKMFQIYQRSKELGPEL